MIGNAAIEPRRDMPPEVWAWSNEVVIHRPVHVRRERQAIAGIIVLGFAERVDVGRLDHRRSVRQHQPQARRRASVVV